MKMQQIDDETQFGQQNTDSSEETTEIIKVVQSKFAEVAPSKVRAYIIGWVTPEDDESDETNIHLHFGGTDDAKIHLMLSLIEMLQLRKHNE